MNKIVIVMMISNLFLVNCLASQKDGTSKKTNRPEIYKADKRRNSELYKTCEDIFITFPELLDCKYPNVFPTNDQSSHDQDTK